MKTYSVDDVKKALRAVGIGKGDLVFLFVRLHTLGRMEGCRSSEDVGKAYFEAVFDVIGDNGTLVTPTYSQQVGTFGIDYHNETTESLCGVISEYVRTHPASVRSFHPVHSLTAIGKYAREICGNVSTSSFGIRSAFDNLFKRGGHSVCLGFEYHKGHIVTGAHYVECTYAVPYYYNKIVKANVHKNGKLSDKIFTINVMYKGFVIKNDYKRYIEEIDRKGFLKQHPVGDGILYSSDLKKQLEVGYDMLSEDIYSFLKSPPVWRDDIIPNEGTPEHLSKQEADNMNWTGYIMHSWRHL
ncbi:MAG: AAC(3) family N-acetyltransferase [Anaerohalosphaeraceae bacterium]|nr:AAC(3) family N-acetyltransferase [Anaerohalosphaeraceae bacterium]